MLSAFEYCGRDALWRRNEISVYLRGSHERVSNTPFAPAVVIGMVLLTSRALFFCIRFVREVNATVEVLHPIHCSKERKVKVEMDMTTVPAMLVVLILLYAAFKPRAPKPKIN